MNIRSVHFMPVLTLAASLIGCATSSPSPRLALTQTTTTTPQLELVHTTENCPVSDDGGFGADVRHFGDTTPSSENPFLNPCWPN